MVHILLKQVIPILLLACCSSIEINGPLVVNVKYQEGDVFQESISANILEDTISMQFTQPDGTSVTQVIDVKNEMQITNMIILGEEELREASYLTFCFVTSFKKTDFIPPDAMAKLRQKNPWTVRVPEKDAGRDNVTLDVLLDITSADWISPHIKTVCADASDGTYARKDDLMALVSSKMGNNIDGQQMSVEAHEQFMRAVKPFPVTDIVCGSIRDQSKPCQCEVNLCLAWYPCALKYCRSQDSAGKSVSHRCGIHTCKSCRKHIFAVPRKYSCLINS